jgi:cytoskeletal protein CcmA (bactofilin family)
MFGRRKRHAADGNRDPSSGQTIEPPAVADSASQMAPEAVSSISSGLSFVGKIAGKGTLTIFGHVEGELQASNIQISDGAQVDGNIVAEELTIGGRVKGTIRANRVRLNSTAVVDGDIFHRSIAIEENARFEGVCRWQENASDTPSRASAKLPRVRASNNGSRKNKTHLKISNAKGNAHELTTHEGSPELLPRNGSGDLIKHNGSAELLPHKGPGELATHERRDGSPAHDASPGLLPNHDP